MRAMLPAQLLHKAATVWSSETGIDRNPADEVEVLRPDDQRERYLSAEEIQRLKQALDEKMYRKGRQGHQPDVLSVCA